VGIDAILGQVVAPDLGDVALSTAQTGFRWGDDMVDTDSLSVRDPVHLSWPVDPRVLTHLRDVVQTWLVGLGFSSDTTGDVVLAASEAASNTIDHAYPTIDSANTLELRLWVEDSAAHVEVVDHGRWRTPQPTPSGRGLGLPMMRQLVDTVVIDHGPSGTTVLLRHPLPRGAPA
jgi:serine/threonine-protein kinase RsbW